MGRTNEFTGIGNDFLTAEMSRNFLTMKKIKSTRSVFFGMSIAFMAAQFAFTVLGGLNVFMLSGLIINAVTLAFCLRKSNKTFGLLMLSVFNALLFFLYLIYVFFHKMYIDYFIAITGHLFLAIEAFVTSKHKELDFELSSQPGYPYFTEMAKMEIDRKEYIPDNDMSSCRRSKTTSMDEIDLSAVYGGSHNRVKLEKNETCEMSGVSMQDVPERYYADPFVNEEKLQTERKE